MKSILCLSGRERSAVDVVCFEWGGGGGSSSPEHTPLPCCPQCTCVYVCVPLSMPCALKSELRARRNKPETAGLDLDSGMTFPLRSLTVLRRPLLFPYLAAWSDRWCGDRAEQLSGHLREVLRGLYLFAAQGHASRHRSKPEKSQTYHLSC